MKDWLRFAVCYWHTWREMGATSGLGGTMTRSWDEGHATEMDAALNRVDVHFEFCQRLGIEYYCFHDRDVSPEGATVKETEAMFDKVADKLLAKQKETGMKLLWGTANLFSHKRFMHGGPTNPDPEVMCMAAAQVKKCLDVTKKLGGSNFVMWGGRDGYQTLLNTDYKRENDNYAQFLKVTADYADSIDSAGSSCSSRSRASRLHQYSFDAETTLGFLDHYGLTPRFSLSLTQPWHPRWFGRARGRGRPRSRQARLDRRQPQRDAPRMGHGHVPDRPGTRRT